MYIETSRTIVRDFLMGDAEDLQEILGDEAVMEYMESPYDPKQTTGFLQDFCIDKKGALACEHRASKKVIGYILFKPIEPEVYEIGWLFNRNFWRQGYAYESCQAVMNFAFETMRVHKIFAETIDGKKAVGLMEKLGMKPEGIQKSHTKDNKGNWADFYLYGKVRKE